MPFTTHFPGWYSTSDCNSESGGSLRALNSNNDILDIAHYRNGSRPSSSIDLHLGYNKEALKQTMLKHEAIFRDQVFSVFSVFAEKSLRGLAQLVGYPSLILCAGVISVNYIRRAWYGLTGRAFGSYWPPKVPLQ